MLPCLGLRSSGRSGSFKEVVFSYARCLMESVACLMRLCTFVFVPKYNFPGLSRSRRMFLKVTCWTPLYYSCSAALAQTILAQAIVAQVKSGATVSSGRACPLCKRRLAPLAAVWFSQRRVFSKHRWGVARVSPGYSPPELEVPISLR